MPGTGYYGRRRLSPFLGVVQVIEQDEARAISVDGRRWQLQLYSQEVMAEPVWGNSGPRDTRRRWFIYGSCVTPEAIERIPVNPLLGDPSLHPALPGLLEALAQRPELPFALQDAHEAWFCDADGAPVALIDTALPGEEQAAFEGSRWRSLPLQAADFHSDSGYPAQRGLMPAQALEWLVGQAVKGGQVRWFKHEANPDGNPLPELPWRTCWPVAEQQALFDDYTAFLAPYLLTLPYLGVALRDRLEAQAVEQYTVLDAIYPLIPAVVDRERMEVARVKAQLAHE